jgi:hypothetical protein
MVHKIFLYILGREKLIMTSTRAGGSWEHSWGEIEAFSAEPLKHLN